MTRNAKRTRMIEEFEVEVDSAIVTGTATDTITTIIIITDIITITEKKEMIKAVTRDKEEVAATDEEDSFDVDDTPLSAGEVSAVLGYPIDDFQTRTLKVIVQPTHDLLAMAPTGSGKTAVALQAILQVRCRHSAPPHILPPCASQMLPRFALRHCSIASLLVATTHLPRMAGLPPR